MRLGKPTRLERQIHKSFYQQKAQEWARDHGYKPMGAPDDWSRPTILPMTEREILYAWASNELVAGADGLTDSPDDAYMDGRASLASDLLCLLDELDKRAS